MFIKSNFLSTKQKVARAILGILILLTLALIFVQSILPPDVANAEADIASDIVEEVIGEDSPASEVAVDNIDKIAHLTEFGLLGLFVSLYVLHFAKRLILSFLPMIGFASAIAIIDETIQIFSGRTPDTVDALFDVIGFSIISILTYIVFFAIRSAKRKRNF